MTVNDGAETILTNGDGAAGIRAQSLATGGIVQELDGVNVATEPQLAPSLNLSSSGGAVQVSVPSSIVTTGAYAPGIFAQSAGYGGIVGQIGGGGLTFAGSARLSCPSCGNGAVTVNVGSGGYVAVSGNQSWGVVMLAVGDLIRA